MALPMLNTLLLPVLLEKNKKQKNKKVLRKLGSQRVSRQRPAYRREGERRTKEENKLACTLRFCLCRLCDPFPTACCLWLCVCVGVCQGLKSLGHPTGQWRNEKFTHITLFRSFLPCLCAALLLYCSVYVLELCRQGLGRRLHGQWREGEERNRKFMYLGLLAFLPPGPRAWLPVGSQRTK